jgi:predicted dehydrogenase
MSRLRVAVIGVGHLGKEHARILAGMPEVELVGVADLNLNQAQSVAERCGTRSFGDYWPLLNLVEAATIVVPTTLHHAVAVEFLKRGIPLLIEKPLAPDPAQANELVELARQQGAVLQVGHIERFNPAFEELQLRPIQPKFVECERLGPFTGRSMDIGVVMDLMIHDLDLLLALVKAPVRSVEALGVALFGSHEDVANARLTFANGCVANLSASRVNPAARRQMRVWGPEGYAHVDFPSRQLRLVQPVEAFHQRQFVAGKVSAGGGGNIRKEHVGQCFQTMQLEGEKSDQLTCELRHFIHCVQAGLRPRISGEEGRDAVALAARILEQIRTHQWEGIPDGPVGPRQVPPPLGPLFVPAPDKAAA